MTRIMYLLGAIVLLAGGGAATANATDNGEGHTPVAICHKPGTPAQQTLVVDDDAVPGHLGHGDYLGACEGNPPPCPEGTVLEGEECVPVTPPTDFCDTLPGVQAEDEDCPPPVINPQCTVNCTPPGPPHQVTGAAGVFCDKGARLYRLQGTIDGIEADSVSPATLPGNSKGTLNVTVKRGDTIFFTTVTVLGDCDTTVPVVVVTPAAAPPAVASPAPSVKPKPPARKPAVKPKPKPKHKAKPRPKRVVHICKPYKDGTERVWGKNGCMVPRQPILAG